MQNMKNFNFPAFHAAAAKLRAEGWEVFSPAERDLAVYGSGMFQSGTGDLAQACAQGFNLDEALAADTRVICLEVGSIHLLPGWENSKGAFAEWALARALGRQIHYLANE
jgi:hypothetical protein